MRGITGAADGAVMAAALSGRTRWFGSGFQRVVRDLEEDAIPELRSVPGWRAHRLTGDRKGVRSLSVTANWRLTFRIGREEMEIIDLDYEDYP